MPVGHIQGMDIRDRINSIIAENPDMSVRSVSLAAGLSDSALHKFLSGATESLTMKTVDKLAEALGVDARWLAYGEGTPERASEISDIWDRISKDQREQAKRVLEAFTRRTGTDN
jgi:transcriptional regulator with XRE-family HTH domain